MEFYIHINIDMMKPMRYSNDMIGRGFAEVQILKTVKSNSLTVWNILIKFCEHIDIDKI